MYWNRDIETLDRAGLEKMQLTLLGKTVEQAGKSPYYRALFQQEGVGADTIKRLDDIRRIPFITKDTLREHYPYGFVAAPREQLVRMHSSSGTTGRAMYSRT